MFGVNYNNQSIFNYGDVSTCSFHTRKTFHTGEGGTIFCNDSKLFPKLYYSYNFGKNGPETFYELGINAKISELQLSIGLAVLYHDGEIFKESKKVGYFIIKI